MQKQGTQKHSASHRPHACHGQRGQTRATGNPCHAQPPAHLNGQRVSTKPETKQAVHAPVTQGQLKVPRAAKSTGKGKSLQCYPGMPHGMGGAANVPQALRIRPLSIMDGILQSGFLTQDPGSGALPALVRRDCLSTRRPFASMPCRMQQDMSYVNNRQCRSSLGVPKRQRVVACPLRLQQQ